MRFLFVRSDSCFYTFDSSLGGDSQAEKMAGEDGLEEPQDFSHFSCKTSAIVRHLMQSIFVKDYFMGKAKIV